VSAEAPERRLMRESVDDQTQVVLEWELDRAEVEALAGATLAAADVDVHG